MRRSRSDRPIVSGTGASTMADTPASGAAGGVNIRIFPGRADMKAILQESPLFDNPPHGGQTVRSRRARFAKIRVFTASGNIPMTTRKILVTSALPYANGSIHLGH